MLTRKWRIVQPWLAMDRWIEDEAAMPDQTDARLVLVLNDAAGEYYMLPPELFEQQSVSLR
jgi:hypothetical protein